MSIALLNWVCDMTGASDQLFIDYLNNKNNVPESIVYILMIRKAYGLVETCVKTGFVMDQNCMNIACIMADLQFIKLCTNCKLTPSSENVNNVIKYCVPYKRTDYRVYKGYATFELTSKFIYEKDNMYKIIYQIFSGYSFPPDLWSEINRTAISPRPSMDYHNPYCLELYRLLNNIQPVNKYCSSSKITANKMIVIDCLNHLLSNNYVMIPENWKVFNESLRSVKSIIINDINNMRSLCTLNISDIIACIKKNKSPVDETCLENAVKAGNFDLIKFLIEDRKISVNKNMIDYSIKNKKSNISRLLLENCKVAIENDAAVLLLQNAFDEYDADMIKFIINKFKIYPPKQMILKHIKQYPIFEYLVNMKLISCDTEKKENTTSQPTTVNTTVNTNANTNTNINTKSNSDNTPKIISNNATNTSSSKPWFLC